MRRSRTIDASRSTEWTLAFIAIIDPVARKSSREGKGLDRSGRVTLSLVYRVTNSHSPGPILPGVQLDTYYR